MSVPDAEIPLTSKIPIQIASPPKAGTSDNFQLNIDPLLEILIRPEIADLPLVIYSANGHLRCGKSFFLNQIVRYLIYGKSHSDTWIDQQLTTEFNWKNQYETVTQGIQLYPDPFIIQDETNPDNRLAVILLDNQGLEDDTTDESSTFKLFCLSNLLSSVFTYCESKFRSKNFVENLHQYAQFSKAVQHDVRPDGTQEDVTFGTLIIQCKDFRYYREFPCAGCEFYDANSHESLPPGKCFYSRVFSSADNATDDVKAIRTALTAMYGDIIVCTMQGPGNSEPDDDVFSKSDSWDPQHLLGIKKFISRVFNYKFLRQRVKRVGGQEVTAEQLMPLAEHWIRNLSHSNYDMSSLTSLEYTTNCYYEDKIQKSLLIYKELLEEYRKDTGDVALTIENFQISALAKIKNELWKNCLYKERKDEFEKLLESKVAEHLKDAKTILMEGHETEKDWQKVLSNLLILTGSVATFVGRPGLFPLTTGQRRGLAVAGAVAVPVGIAVETKGAVGVWWQKRKKKKIEEAINNLINRKNEEANVKERITSTQETLESYQ